MPARGTVLAHRVLIFLQADASTIFRQYKQVCERAKAKVECWHPAQVVEQWPIYADKLLSDNKMYFLPPPPDFPSFVALCFKFLCVLVFSLALKNAFQSLVVIVIICGV